MVWMMIDKWRSDPDHVTAPACTLKHRFISEWWSKPSNGGVAGGVALHLCVFHLRTAGGAVFSGFHLAGSEAGPEAVIKMMKERQGPELSHSGAFSPDWARQNEGGGGQRERERERELLPTRESGISVTSTRTIQWLRLNQTWSFSYFTLWLFHYELK